MRRSLLLLLVSCGEQQDEVGDGIPQSIMGDYTVGAELLSFQRTAHQPQRMPASGDGEWLSSGSSCTDHSENEPHAHTREVATRPPTPTRLTEASKLKAYMWHCVLEVERHGDLRLGNLCIG